MASDATTGKQPHQRRRARRIVQAACLIAAVALASSAAIATSRALTDDEFTRRAPADCATNAEYAKHSPMQIERCITRSMRGTITRDGLLPALIDVQRAANRSPILKAECHLALHENGREQQRAGVTIADLDGPLTADANWNSSCAGGFLHGYLQATAEHADAPELRAIATSWCAGLREQNRKGCAHAVGHGLSRVNDNDLVGSAADCRQLPRELQGDCLSGAVMELNFADARLAERMAPDTQIAAPGTIDCSKLAANQRTWCRTLFVKGELLIAGLKTVG